MSDASKALARKCAFVELDYLLHAPLSSPQGMEILCIFLILRTIHSFISFKNDRLNTSVHVFNPPQNAAKHLVAAHIQHCFMQKNNLSKRICRLFVVEVLFISMQGNVLFTQHS